MVAAMCLTTMVAAQTGNKSAKASVEGKAYSFKGAIDHETWTSGQQSTLTFTGIPASVDEFKLIQEKIGTDPQGAVLLQILAFELYRNNPAAGEACIRLNNTQTNANTVLGRLKELFNTKDEYYARPYLAASFCKGATPENGYNPSKPYTVEVRVNPNSKYQNSSMLHGTVIYLQAYSNGYDTPWRGVEVVKPKGNDYFVVSSCPAFITQCKEMEYGETYKGL